MAGTAGGSAGAGAGARGGKVAAGGLGGAGSPEAAIEGREAAGAALPAPLLERSVRLEPDAVMILDRRVFPHEVVWVAARSGSEVADALRAMVTQSTGPIFAALAGLVLTVRQRASGPGGEAADAVRDVAGLLVAARPTNNSVGDAVRAVVAALDAQVAVAVSGGGAVDGAQVAALVEREAAAQARWFRRRCAVLAGHAAALLEDGARLLTHCWMDTYLIELVRAGQAAGKRFSYVATETRPYLQGARLTAHTLAEMGQEVTLVTDAMAAAVLSPFSALGPVDALVTAADRVSMDGHVFNKVGTLGAAVAAHAFGVPFYVLIQAPDPCSPTAADVVVERRDGAEVLSVQGVRTASPLVRQGYYPAFDVTPPQFVTRIVTDRGPLEARRMAAYFAAGDDEQGQPAAPVPGR
jgi:methylthioribose-1-phosphate isomerase